MASVAKGWRVVRGPDWKYEDQDGGKGHLGTIKDVPGGNQTGLVVVQWDYGYRGRYRIGADNAYDLLLWDNAPAGTKHKGVECNECSYHTKGGLAGVRWKCMDCPNYDLCTPCYLAGEHETNHAFWRYTSAEATGVQMPIRQGCEQQDVFGFFPKAEVARGPDWKYGDQDGGNDSRGRIKDLTEMNDVARSAATVIWSSKASFAEIQ
ncbi:E3 ubiquitin-protein ligase MIB2-like [Diadema antillarum]|uniref:E3 ubiquitin-protein ligase MIB2-like n=1 Tax=Diadema antillarum TaxID=105358 RepID=UPI003A87E573